MSCPRKPALYITARRSAREDEAASAAAAREARARLLPLRLVPHQPRDVAVAREANGRSARGAKLATARARLVVQPHGVA